MSPMKVSLNDQHCTRYLSQATFKQLNPADRKSSIKILNLLYTETYSTVAFTTLKATKLTFKANTERVLRSVRGSSNSNIVKTVSILFYFCA